MLLIHRAERADVLAQALAELLADVPADPFAAEVVAVPTRGIERWLTQRLSARLGSRPGSADGICANVEFPLSGALIGESLALASGIAPERDPWQPARLVWPLIEVVEEALDEPWLEPLARHLIDGREQRYARLAHVARLFDEYAVRRPEMIHAWSRGESGGVDERAASGWQPELWRRLREALGVPSLAERLAPACAALADDPGSGPAAPTPGAVRTDAAADRVICRCSARSVTKRDVHLMLLHPSPAMWGRRQGPEPPAGLLGSRRARPAEAGAGKRRGSASSAPRAGCAGRRCWRRCRRTSVTTSSRQDRRCAPVGWTSASTLTAADRSIRIHACHGRARQVEVLREAILHRLADDPTLEPRDVIVMCPDIESFAPLIEAAFGGRASR